LNRFSTPSPDTLEKNATPSAQSAYPTTTNSHPGKPPLNISRPTAFINLSALAQNAQQLKLVAPFNRLLLVIKANAYGHGLIDVAKTCQDLTDYLAVARLDEAIPLREAGVSCAIVVLSERLEKNNVADFVKHGLIPCLYSDKDLQEQLSLVTQYTMPYWLKINTGMNRLGLSPDFLIQNASWFTKNNHPNTILTHFSESESSNHQVSQQQIAHFEDILTTLNSDSSITIDNTSLSLNNSAATLKSFATHLGKNQINRCGIALYGVTPQTLPTSMTLSPVMALYAPIIDIHHLQAGDRVGYNGSWAATETCTTATIGIGYGDGYPRQAQNGTPVFIHGEAAELVGRVSMDMITVKLNKRQENLVRTGDPACLWGDELPVEAVAKHCDTIAYDLLTGLNPRVNRVYNNRQT